MDIFGDKKFEELDWLTKTVEPFVCYINPLLESIPDRMVLTFEDVRAVMDPYGMSINENSVIYHLLKNRLGVDIGNIDGGEILECFELVLEGGDKLLTNFETQEMSGAELVLVKIKRSFSEDEIIKIFMGRRGLEHIKSMEVEKANYDRLSEVLDLMSSPEALRKRTLASKFLALQEAYAEAMKQNKWNIRSIDLSNKVAFWIVDYILTGNYASMVNFCKVKAVSHRGYPIYEIEEEA